ncbi:hypothetical protein [Tsukamurella soli]
MREVVDERRQQKIALVAAELDAGEGGRPDAQPSTTNSASLPMPFAGY